MISTDWALICSPNNPPNVPTSFAQNTLFADTGALGEQRPEGARLV
jgi:hypothetical protein